MRVLSVLVSASSAFITASPAIAQKQAQGFAVERFNPSPPGGSWLVMDDLNLSGGLGAGASLAMGYASRPLVVHSEGDRQYLSVVSDQAFFDIGMAATYQRFRFYMNLVSPIVLSGQNGTIGDYRFTAPTANLDERPDMIADVRLGVDTRLLGQVQSPARLGASLQVFVPSGNRFDYLTDDSYRAMGRVLFAGDTRLFAYAANVGLHVRPLDMQGTPSAPRGNELLFGTAAGTKVPLGSSRVIIGPELFGETALKSFFGSGTTALEALISARFEGTRADGASYRIKLGSGRGLTSSFGAPEWRVVIGFELFGRYPE